MRKSISFLRTEHIKFNGIISIPPKQSFEIKISIKHLYKSFVLYLSNNKELFDLFLAKYGGLVIINEFLILGGCNIVSCLIIISFLGSIS